MKNLVIVDDTTPTSTDTLYIRSKADSDGDLTIEVSRDSSFIAKETIGYFTLSAGKLAFYKYSNLQRLADVMHLTDGEIECR